MIQDTKYGQREPSIELRDIPTNDFWWLVGILEGEGTFSGGIYPQIKVEMKDYDIIEKVNSIINHAANKNYIITTMNPRKSDWSTTYKCSASGAAAIALLRLIHPHMGERRKEQIEDTLNTGQRPKDKPPLTLTYLGLKS